jgi:hypothetical protein
MELRIEASDLPGSSCGPSPERPQGHHNIHVAVQRRNKPKELLGWTRADASDASWTLEVDDNFRGPYVQGKLGEQFVYLSWGVVDDAGNFEMFRRAKLKLNEIDPAIIKAARNSGVLVGRLGLTDAKGNPACATVGVEWSAGSI